MNPQMISIADVLRPGKDVSRSSPWPHAIVGTELWQTLCNGLADGRWTLLDLWAEPDQVHLALWDAAGATGGLASLACAGDYPAVSRSVAPALRLERAISDLHGIEPLGMPDRRPWLDHGRWGVRHPLGARAPAPDTGAPYDFLPVEGPELHQISVGPVHAGIIEPGHFRFTASGETVVRLEQRLGYVHKGTESLMIGKPLQDAARLAGRVSGDSTVAYAFAFARAVEAAAGVTAPPRAQWLRALMAELERVANHLGDIGAVCNDASFALLHAHCGILREQVLRTSFACFGHRLMMDRVVPGGVAVDLPAGGATRIRALVADIRARWPQLVEVYDSTASLQDRTVNTGIVKPELARRFGAGGFVGRSAGRAFDARRTPGYAPYDALRFEVPVLAQGDVNARVWLRIRETEQSLSLIEQILGGLPAGATVEALPASGAASEGTALVESFRGDVFAWVRLAADGTVARCRLRDPSWFQWPLLVESAVEGNIIADFPLCNKSFNCSYSGHDL